MRTTSTSKRSNTRVAWSRSKLTSARRGAGLPWASAMSSMTSTPSMKTYGVGTRTPAACRRRIMSTSVERHDCSSCARP
jgi:hypothetical protein